LKHLLIIFSILLSLGLAAQDSGTGSGSDTGSGGTGTGSGSGSTAAPTTVAWPSDIMDRISRELEGEIDGVGADLSASIFESLTDIDLFKFDVMDGSGKINIYRKVYDNHDIIDSWTAVDTLRVPISFPVALTDPVSVGSGNFNLNLSVALGVRALNIRQVLPKDFRKLPNLEELKKEVKELISLKKKVESAKEKKEDIADPKPEDSDGSVKPSLRGGIIWNSRNPQTRARYSKLLNLLSNPFKIPLTEKRIKKMPVGEISSYTLDGSIQLGANVGWSATSFIGLDTASVGVGVTTYLSGSFQVSVLKESKRYAKLKVTRRRSHGVSTTLGSVSVRHEVFEGFLVLGHRIGDFRANLVPFSLGFNTNVAKSFDVAYRYDLEDPNGLKAYKRAAFGRLKLSEEYSQARSGVEKIIVRHQREVSHSRSYKMKLSILYERAHYSRDSVAAAVITLDGEDHHLFRAITDNSKAFDTIWGHKELKRYRFHTTIDGQLWQGPDNKGMSLMVEGTLEDSKTNGKELLRYMHEVETATGIPNIFERAPINEPTPDRCLNRIDNKPVIEDKKEGLAPLSCLLPKKTRYGKSSFHFRIGYHRNQLRKFANFPTEKMWPILEKAFKIKAGKWQSARSRFWHFFKRIPLAFLNIPLYLVDGYFKKGGDVIMAKRFFKRWKKLKRTNDPHKLAKKIAKLFRTVNFSRELVYIIREALKGEEISYFIQAKAKPFGQFTKQGKNIPKVDTVTQRAQQALDFDRVGSRITVDPEALVGALKIDKDDDDPDKVTIRFHLPKEPHFLFFRVDKTSNWGKFKNIFKMVIANKEIFKPGDNTIVIKREEKLPGLKKTLSEALFRGKYVTLKMATSRNRQTWGPVSSYRIRIKKASDDEADDDDDDDKPETK
jgi:hypothetical protein